MNRYVSETLGTFLLVFCGTGAIIITEQTGQPGHAGIAATFGLVVMVLVYALAKYSGAQFNPAVSIALALHKKLSLSELLAYITCQISGAILSSLLLRVLFPDNANLGSTLPSGALWQSFILEFLLTFFLMLVILATAGMSKYHEIIAPLAIGATVGLEAMFAGPITGASMNPARSIGPALVSGNLSALWIYIAAPVAGAIAASFLIRKDHENIEP